MDARSIEQAEGLLRARRRAMVESSLLAAISAAAAAGLGFYRTWLALAFGVAAGAETLLAAKARHDRRDLISRLALEDAAYVLPEVRSFGSHLVETRQRQRLADWLLEILSSRGVLAGWCLRDRVDRYHSGFCSLAQELASPLTDVTPTSVAACLRLLTRAVESPLYNPNIPPDELGLALHRIRSGISGSGSLGQSSTARGS